MFFFRLVNRRVEQRQEHSITHTEITQRRILQDKGPEMQHYKGVSQSENIGKNYHHSNGHSEHSPNSSHLSVNSEDALVSRTHKQQTTQQVTTVTKVVREVKHLDGQQVDYGQIPLDVQHMGQDGQPLDYVAMPLGMYPRSQYMNYNHMEQAAGHHLQHQPHHIYLHGGGAVGQPVGQQVEQQYHSHPHYQDYEHYPSAAQYTNSIPFTGHPDGLVGQLAGVAGLNQPYEYSTNER